MSGRKTSKDPWSFDKIEFLPGVYIGKTKKSGGNWKLFYWLKAEKRPLERALRTKDKDEALRKAKLEYLAIFAREQSGEKIFSISVDELCDWYLERRSEEVPLGHITAQRLVTIKSQLKAVREFLGPKTKVSSIKGEQFRIRYTQFRLGKSSLHTIKNERSTINNLFSEALKAKKITHDQMPEWEKTKVGEEPRREEFSGADWRKLSGNIRHWAAKAGDAEERYRREILRDFVLICANTGLRFGEARQLRWRDVRKVATEKKTGKKIVHLALPAHITKNRRSRTVIGLGGEHVLRRKEARRFAEPEDYVFCSEKGKLYSRKRLYADWKSMMEYVGLAERTDLTFYCLRHTYATFRIVLGDVHPSILAQNMGCGIAFLEKHYVHVRTEQMIKELTNTISKDDSLYVTEQLEG